MPVKKLIPGTERFVYKIEGYLKKPFKGVPLPSLGII